MNERPSDLHKSHDPLRKVRVFTRIARKIVASANVRSAGGGPASPMTPSEKLARLIEDREKQTTILLGCASAGITMLTYFGVSGPMTEAGDGIMHKGEALAFASMIGIFSFLAWEYIFKVLPTLTGRRLVAGIVGMTIYVGGIAVVDAQFNMLALGGDQAVQYSLVDTLRSYETARGRVVAQSAAAERLLPFLKAEAKRFEMLGEREFAGSGTGKPGPGKVRDGFLQIAKLLGELDRVLSASIVELRKADTEAAATLRAMKTTTYTPGKVRDRVAALSNQADQLDTLLGQIAQRDTATAIKATATSLRGIIPPTGAARSTFEATQNVELARIGEMAKPVADALENALGPAKRQAGEIIIEPIRPQNAMTAIKTYWRELLPQWVAALFVDFAPAILVATLLAARSELDRLSAPKPNKKERS